MIILSWLLNGFKAPPLVPSLPLEGLGVGVVPVASDLERSREDWPISQCCSKLALGEEEPGLVVPKAQMMFSVPIAPT